MEKYRVGFFRLLNADEIFLHFSDVKNSFDIPLGFKYSAFAGRAYTVQMWRRDRVEVKEKIETTCRNYICGKAAVCLSHSEPNEGSQESTLKRPWNYILRARKMELKWTAVVPALK